MKIVNIKNLNFYNKKVLIRVDLNVPIKNKKILSNSRIIAALPTIKLALENNAKVILASHLGRPSEGKYDEKYSLKPVVNVLKKYLVNKKVVLIKNYLNGLDYNIADVIVLENVRFNIGEKNNSTELAKKYAALCDIFIMDAFACAHRIHASTYGIVKFVNMSCMGKLLLSEIKALNAIINNPKNPMVAVIGGAKVSTKFELLYFLTKKASNIIVGGGIANTFIAINNNVGNSLYEKSFVHDAKDLYNTKKICIPIDVRVKNYNLSTGSVIKNINKINKNEKILDIGNKTIDIFLRILKHAKTILWNGPMGMFELSDFARGTEIIANYIANSNAFSVAGGGETLAVIDKYNLKNKISYISTGGGAFLKFLEGCSLPCIEQLTK